MRFHNDGPNIPDNLLERCDAGRVVFLCGAGVSLPSGMPTFIGLTQHVIDFFDPPDGSEILRAFQPWVDDPTGSNMPLDQIFNLLHQEYGKDEVNSLVTERLIVPNDAADVGHHHSLIKRISSNPNGIPQIVTTNFDLLFELGGDFAVHVPPAFPSLAFGTSIEGITYLHGRLADTDAEHHPYVLSSAAVKQFLVPVETDRHPFYRFTREIKEEEPITARFPEATLDLVHTVTPRALTRGPYELPKILSVIAETDLSLTSDHRYLRLIDLVERS